MTNKLRLDFVRDVMGVAIISDDHLNYNNADIQIEEFAWRTNNGEKPYRDDVVVDVYVEGWLDTDTDHTNSFEWSLQNSGNLLVKYRPNYDWLLEKQKEYDLKHQKLEIEPETPEENEAWAQLEASQLPNSGMKHDSDKPRYDLLPPLAVDEMAKVMTFGAKKYAPNNWQKVDNPIERYTAALLRHTFAMMRGETHDKETGLLHSAHAMCCSAFIAESQKRD
ncbi:dATP/dGTP diphosphohydrolase domain-containing protein [Vibrio casei]|uniref:dATP/dGTP diphosphohydrolase domain-containing protein n=2 Tax=Vibrio casei TaxID=673372 RepID=UPI003F997157